MGNMDFWLHYIYVRIYVFFIFGLVLHCGISGSISWSTTSGWRRQNGLRLMVNGGGWQHIAQDGSFGSLE